MTDIHLRKVGRTGRITLDRPDALNALTGRMIAEVRAILPVWAADDEITMLVIDAAGDKAFCAGGDIAGIYDALVAGDLATVRQFWRDEYPMNLALFDFPKPVAAFLQGFTMGGGVGMGCHASHRVVCASSRIALPECGIGLVPDVGGSLLLARAPGRLGEYLGTTAHRMGPADAIHAGFADYHIDAADWPDLIARLEATGDWDLIDAAATDPGPSDLAANQPTIDRYFGGETLRDILNGLDTAAEDDWTRRTMTALGRNAPLAMAAAIQMIHRTRMRDRMDEALRLEYRFAHRVAAQGDFQEGIRAAIIDKDRTPRWRHDSPAAPTAAEVGAMLQPLGPDELDLTGGTP